MSLDHIQQASREQFDRQSRNYGPSHILADVADIVGALDGVFLLIDGSVPDGEPQAAEWIHAVEKWRDPSHGRFLSPCEWSGLCRDAGLEILKCGTTPFKQPDLHWYFETAGTPQTNRDEVMKLIKSAPDQAVRAFGLAEEDGKIIWWWPRLSLVARRN
ncbi:MAG: hypothetical protein NTV93_13885 [Verrucomicrobia bacterium]|nr:hypothetical protein [Verrucomicrobiota bacterium]